MSLSPNSTKSFLWPSWNSCVPPTWISTLINPSNCDLYTVCIEFCKPFNCSRIREQRQTFRMDSSNGDLPPNCHLQDEMLGQCHISYVSLSLSTYIYICRNIQANIAVHLKDYQCHSSGATGASLVHCSHGFGAHVLSAQGGVSCANHSF